MDVSAFSLSRLLPFSRGSLEYRAFSLRHLRCRNKGRIVKNFPFRHSRSAPPGKYLGSHWPRSMHHRREYVTTQGPVVMWAIHVLLLSLYSTATGQPHGAGFGRDPPCRKRRRFWKQLALEPCGQLARGLSACRGAAPRPTRQGFGRVLTGPRTQVSDDCARVWTNRVCGWGGDKTA